jgi:hypothetical protein
MGEVIKVDFSNSGRQIPPIADSMQAPGEMKLGNLSERALLLTAIQRELRLIKANQQVVVGEITIEELYRALDQTVEVNDYLTKEQQGAVATFAQGVYESNLTA